MINDVKSVRGARRQTTPRRATPLLDYLVDWMVIMALLIGGLALLATLVIG